MKFREAKKEDVVEIVKMIANDKLIVLEDEQDGIIGTLQLSKME